MVRRLALILTLPAALASAFAAPAAGKLVGFQTENHKVGCYMNGKGARCDVKRPKWDPAPRPPGCELDWGQGVAVTRRGAAGYVCAGDTTLDRNHDELAPGEKVKTGRFKCKALDRSTIKCINKRNGYGFTVSRSEVRLFRRQV